MARWGSASPAIARSPATSRSAPRGPGPSLNPREVPCLWLDAQGLELLAEGPLSAEPQPGVGEDLRVWLAARLADPGAGEPIFRDVLLPAGPAVMVERTDRPATATARQHRAWAIRTPAGVAFLWIDGPPGAWDVRKDDLARIPMFLEVTR